MVPIAAVAFLAAAILTLLTWRRQPKPSKAFSIVVVLVCIWQLQHAVLRRIPALWSGVQTTSPVVWDETFDARNLDQWREVSLHGQTHYQVCELDGDPCLCARSQAAASILLREVRIDPQQVPWLEWRWRVDELVEGEALHQKSGSDAAARLYVYFDTGILRWRKRSLNYIWAASLPVGTMLTSAFSATAKIIVVESGSEHLGQWRTVKRNFLEDYRRAFGDEPPTMIAVGVMSDTDNTKSSAQAYFDDLRISALPQMAAGASTRPPTHTTP